MESDARTLALKAARLPDSVKHLADEVDEEKDLVVDSATLERINKAKFEESLLREATSTSHRGNFHNRGRSRGYGRRRGFNNGRDRKDFSWKGKAPDRRRETAAPHPPTTTNHPIKTVKGDTAKHAVDSITTIPPTTWGPTK